MASRDAGVTACTCRGTVRHLGISHRGTYRERDGRRRAPARPAARTTAQIDGEAQLANPKSVQPNLMALSVGDNVNAHYNPKKLYRTSAIKSP